MSRRPLNPNGIALPGSPNNGLLKVSLVKVTPDGKLSNPTVGRLLLNPESWQDTKSTNWIANAVPGQSTPIYQWVSGGERLVSFDALVTKDTSEVPYLNATDDPVAGLIDSAVNAVGSIASNFLGVNLPPIADIFANFQDLATEGGDELSIEAKLNYYRSLLYPNYEAGRLISSPPLVVIYAGTTLSTVLNTPTDSISDNHDLWILTELGINVTKQLPNLVPMEAICSFKFAHYTVKSIAASHFDTIEQTPSAPSGGSIGSILGGYLNG